MRASSKEFYDSDAGNYDQKRWVTAAGRENDLSQRRLLVGLCEKYFDANQAMLEVAGGTGRLTGDFLKVCKGVTMIDVSDGMMGVFQKRFANEIAEGRIEGRLGDVRDADFGSARFRQIACINAISHIPNIETVFEKLGSLLAKDGVFLFNFPNLGSIYAPFGKRVTERGTAIGRDVFTRWFTIKEIAELLKRSDMDVVIMMAQLHLPTRMPSVFLPIARWFSSYAKERPYSWFATNVIVVARKR